MTYNPVK